VATAPLTNGDTGIGVTTQLEYRIQGTTNWAIASSAIPSGVTAFNIKGLAAQTAYEWRVKHIRGGQSSAYLGPAAGTQFSTGITPLVPTNGSLVLRLFTIAGHPVYLWIVTWTDTGEDAFTEVYFDGPFGAPPLPGQLSLHAAIPAGQTSDSGSWSGVNGTYYAQLRAKAIDAQGDHFSAYSANISATFP
jgi:hypothetical protein